MSGAGQILGVVLAIATLASCEPLWPTSIPTDAEPQPPIAPGNASPVGAYRLTSVGSTFLVGPYASPLYVTVMDAGAPIAVRVVADTLRLSAGTAFELRTWYERGDGSRFNQTRFGTYLKDAEVLQLTFEGDGTHSATIRWLSSSYSVQYRRFGSDVAFYSAVN